ncbi:HAAS signaling domain-containing protein [Myceligenerans pegani]|uniref:DUF1700 domain-containing protein n=1 Tax=Myceligenerans pegani TaxID=2776917 RepID=A0ABR9MW17_9MICO|nr:DUF1700 domain-containing protein [Myceligenerans sp. TRM 65318]MBE1875577.1 DUF1700 domain-containing protein [Myceligenerans sp. TRM 65318]MBE3017848.1 DUF1700 domain-containing protein [Myceligenerans sp. TRM 65318]
MTERTTMNAITEDAYLRDVGKRLRALTPEQRDAVLDDVRAHFAEAADAGRSAEQAAESLGDPAEFTARVRAELGHDPARVDRMRRTLLWIATGVAVFAAMFAAFWRPDDSLPMPNSQFEVHGFGIVLWYLIPALIAALPVLASVRARAVFTGAVAILLTAVCLAFPDGWVFAPVAVLAWAALGTPVVARHGRPAAGWRITIGTLTAVPAIATLAGALVGSFGIDIWGVLIVAASVGVGVLIAVGTPWAGIVLAVGGVALLIESALNPGYLTLAVWWAGGLFIAVGASHALAHSRPRTPSRG